MKKLSLLLGTLGGALAGYVFSNTNLREELAKAKDADTAGKILAKHLQKDGKQIGREVKQFVQSDVVQDNMKKAKLYVKRNARKLQGDLKGMIKQAPMTIRKVASSRAKTPKAKKSK